jgi:hypothetical protein
MNHNVGSLDRIIRLLAGAAMASSPFVLALPHPAISIIVALAGLTMVLTALTGHCPGYRLMGRSTCSIGPRR